MTRRTHRLAAFACGMVASVGSIATAADQPLAPSHASSNDRANTARIVLPMAAHPEVAVSRSLEAQPVHPHLVQLVVGNAHVTAIDPTVDLRRNEGGIDENHSLVRAQRLARSMQGITTSDLAALSNEHLAARRPAAMGNTAKLIRHVPQDDKGEPVVADAPAAPKAPTAPKRPTNPRELLADSTDRVQAEHPTTTPDAEARS